MERVQRGVRTVVLVTVDKCNDFFLVIRIEVVYLQLLTVTLNLQLY